jgi:hypothetical protein
MTFLNVFPSSEMCIPCRCCMHMCFIYPAEADEVAQCQYGHVCIDVERLREPGWGGQGGLSLAAPRQSDLDTTLPNYY